MKTVFESNLPVEAHMILHLLQGAGIQGQVMGEHLPSGTGELPAVGLVRVVVADEDEAEARSIIADWESALPATEPRPAAARNRLGNSAIAFLAGGLLGALAVWWALRTPVLKNGVDMDGDGLTDMYLTHAGELLERVEYDRNADGKIDQRFHYDRRGGLEAASQDDEFDGAFEFRISYKFDQPVDSAWDRNGNGSADAHCQYRFGVLDECTYRDDSTGRILKRENYVAGVLSGVEVDADGDGEFERIRRLDWMGEEIGAQQPGDSAATISSPTTEQ